MVETDLYIFFFSNFCYENKDDIWLGPGKSFELNGFELTKFDCIMFIDLIFAQKNKDKVLQIFNKYTVGNWVRYK